MTIMNVVQLFGGLGLLLFGIKALGDGLEQAAGQKMKHLMEVLTRNKLMCVLVGALITAVIQSSTATTLMTVGFVNAGLLTLTRAIGVIMGANVGTTVTSLLLSVKLPFGEIFTAVGAICQLFGKKANMKLLGRITMGLGMLFVGMNQMTGAMAPLSDPSSSAYETFKNLMMYATNPVVGALVGAAITALLHSSAASVGILQALASSGTISLQASLFILFGQNIGTCVTALVSSSGANTTAKRTAVVHLLFNLIGTIIFVVVAIVLPLDKWIISIAGDNLKLQIAVAHILFNVVTTLILLPTSTLLEKAATMLVRDKDAEDSDMRLMYYDKRLAATPAVAVQQLFSEVQRMGDLCETNFVTAMDVFNEWDEEKAELVRHNEELLDFLNEEITNALVQVEAMDNTERDTQFVGRLFHVVNDMERIGDHAINIMESAEMKVREEIKFSQKAINELDDLCARIIQQLDIGKEMFSNQKHDPVRLAQVEMDEQGIDDLVAALREHHVDRLKNKKCTPKNAMLYLDLLTNLERVGDHAENIATAVVPARVGGKLA